MAMVVPVTVTVVRVMGVGVRQVMVMARPAMVMAPPVTEHRPQPRRPRSRLPNRLPNRRRAMVRVPAMGAAVPVMAVIPDTVPLRAVDPATVPVVASAERRVLIPVMAAHPEAGLVAALATAARLPVNPVSGRLPAVRVMLPVTTRVRVAAPAMAPTAVIVVDREDSQAAALAAVRVAAVPAAVMAVVPEDSRAVALAVVPVADPAAAMTAGRAVDSAAARSQRSVPGAPVAPCPSGLDAGGGVLFVHRDERSWLTKSSAPIVATAYAGSCC